MNFTKMISKVRWLIGLLSIPVFSIGYIKYHYNVALLGIMLIWICNIWFSMENIKRRILFLMLNITQFVFLIGNPVISAFRGEEWWTRFWDFAEHFSMLVLYLSLIGLYFGAVSVEYYLDKRKSEAVRSKKIADYEKTYMPYIQFVAIAGFSLTWICQMVSGGEKVLFMRGKDYTDFYVDFVSQIPYVIQIAAAMMQYFMCIFLATKPKKKWAFGVLSLNIVSTIPSLIVGIRNPLVLACVFSFVYYFIRDALGDEEKWIGKIEKIMIAVATPIGICLLAAYTYIRKGAEIATKGIVALFLDFFVNQGTSFDVLSSARGAMPYLPERKMRNYTLGGFLDYIFHGSIAQKFFGASPLPDGNNMINALESNSFAHNFSYIAKGKEAYLSGEGFGSSYILETYTDFGYIGVIVFSFLLGALLIYALHLLKKNLLIFTMVLVSLMKIFFIPRAEALGWLQFIIYLQFWIPVICSFLGAVIVRKLVIIQKQRSEMK